MNWRTGALPKSRARANTTVRPSPRKVASNSCAAVLMPPASVRQLRHAADHRRAVEVMAAGTARAIAGEQQRTTVLGEHRCELVYRTVHRGAQILRFAESTVASNADPVQIVAALAACAVRAEIHDAPICGERGIEVAPGRVERYRRRHRQRCPSWRETQMSYPPGPPGRLRLNHSAVFPSGLKVSRISSYCVDATPGAKRSVGPTICSTLEGVAGATQKPAASRPAALSCLPLEVADPVGFPTASPSVEAACSQRAERWVMRDQITRVWIARPSCWSSPKKRPTPASKPPRSGAPIRVGSRPSSHQLSQCRSAALQARIPMPRSGAPGTSIRLSPTLPNPPSTGQLCRVPLNASHASLPASRARRRRWRTFQWPTRKSKSRGASGSFGSGEGCRSAAEPVAPVHFPVRAGISRERLLPPRLLAMDVMPAEPDVDGASLEVITTTEAAAIAFEDAAHGRFDIGRVASIDPPDRPRGRHRIKRTHAQAL